LAIEQLQQAEFECQHKRQLRLDYLNKQLRDEEHSALVFEDVDAAARLAATRRTSIKYQTLVQSRRLTSTIPQVPPKKITSFLFMAGGLALTGWAAFKFL